MRPDDTFKINMGRLTKDQASSIARELRYFWRYLENVYPNGDKKQRPQLRATIDRYGQYHFYINSRALQIILHSVKDFPDPIKQAARASMMQECPPEVPKFLRWG